MPHSRSRFGAAGEALAAEYLERKGYRVLERNVRMPVGELDLVCLAPRQSRFWRTRELVFVEVKTRTSAAFGHPEESVTQAKQRHLIRAAQAYVAGHAAYRMAPYRIDVVAITIQADGGPEILHIPNAVGAI